MRLNLGCGQRKLKDYINVDLCQSADVICDLRKLPKEWEGKADEILSVHTIEHFYLWEVVPLLVEWRRCLKDGGKLILEAPDIKKAALHLLQGTDNPQYTMWVFYGNPDLKDKLHCHHWGYTPETLMVEMRKAGFLNPEKKIAQFKIPGRDFRVEALK